MEQLQTNLHGYLLTPSYANLPLNAKVSILHDIAKGLGYLHNHKPLVIHCDLTAKNVLLSSEREAKISNFGNSRIIDINWSCMQLRVSEYNPCFWYHYLYASWSLFRSCQIQQETWYIFLWSPSPLHCCTSVPMWLTSRTFCDDNGNLCVCTEVESVRGTLISYNSH